MERCRGEKDPLAEFGRRVRATRERRGMTVKALAKAVGTTRQTIGNWEAGRNAASAPLMLSLAEALGTTPRRLWPGWTPDVAPVGGRRQREEAA